MTQDEKDAAFYRQWAAEYDAKNAAKQRPEFDLSDDPYAPSGAAEEAAQQPKPAPVGNVVSMAAAVAARKPKPEPSVTKPYHVVLAGMVIDTVKARKGQDFMFVGKTAYRCLDSLWTMETDGLAGWLNVEIERAAQYMKQPSNNKLIAEARGWI